MRTARFFDHVYIAQQRELREVNSEIVPDPIVRVTVHVDFDFLVDDDEHRAIMLELSSVIDRIEACKEKPE